MWVEVEFCIVWKRVEDEGGKDLQAISISR